MQKATLFLSAGLLLSGLTAQAQYRGRGGNVSLGLKGGASYTSYVGPDTKPAGTGLFDYRFGFHVGAFANIGFSRLFAFQPEILYSQKGADYASLNDRGERLHYLDVPLAFHVNTDGFFFEAGPQVGFLLGAAYHNGSLSTDIGNSFKKLDVGYLLGLGYQKKHGPGVGIRYNGGFTNAPVDYTSFGVTYQSRQRNSAFQLYVTYSFN